MAFIKFLVLALAVCQLSSVSAETSQTCMIKCGNSGTNCYSECLGLIKEMSSGSPTTTYSMSSYETTVPVSTGSTTIEMAFSVVQIYVPKEVSSSTSTEITTSTSLGTDASVMFSTSGTKLIPTATSAILHSSEVTMATAVATHPANNALKAAAGSASLGTVMLTAWIVALLR